MFICLIDFIFHFIGVRNADVKEEKPVTPEDIEGDNKSISSNNGNNWWGSWINTAKSKVMQIKTIQNSSFHILNIIFAT